MVCHRVSGEKDTRQQQLKNNEEAAASLRPQEKGASVGRKGL